MNRSRDQLSRDARHPTASPFHFHWLSVLVIAGSDQDPTADRARGGARTQMFSIVSVEALHAGRRRSPASPVATVIRGIKKGLVAMPIFKDWLLASLSKDLSMTIAPRTLLASMEAKILEPSH
jgi:hypothetical protein